MDTYYPPALVFFCSTKKITITNFCLGKHLIREDDLLKDQRGSPAYISPDVLSGMLKISVFSCIVCWSHLKNFPVAEYGESIIRIFQIL